MITQQRNPSGARRTAATTRRTLLVLFVLTVFAGIPLAGYHLAENAQSDASLQIVGVPVESGVATVAELAGPDIGSTGPGGTVAQAPVVPAVDAASAGMELHLVGGPTVEATRGIPVPDSAVAAVTPVTQTGVTAAEESAATAGIVETPERILHITNVGDRIVVTASVTTDRYAAGAAIEPETGAPAAYSPTGAGNSRPQPPADAEESAGSVSPRADYEDVYPGCPRVLPQGADEAMARERLALYGCLYYAVCTLATEENPSECIWYLNQKI